MCGDRDSDTTWIRYRIPLDEVRIWLGARIWLSHWCREFTSHKKGENSDMCTCLGCAFIVGIGFADTCMQEVAFTQRLARTIQWNGIDASMSPTTDCSCGNNFRRSSILCHRKSEIRVAIRRTAFYWFFIKSVFNSEFSDIPEFGQLSALCTHFKRGSVCDVMCVFDWSR